MFEHNKVNRRIVCKDGFSMSVQASSTSYCSPKIDNAARYSLVEVGFPSDYREPLLKPFGKSEDDPVFAYVPAQRVALIIAKHGGMVEGELPPGVPPLLAKWGEGGGSKNG
jgi:hypothetical protein